jgi:hypothetical protein
VRKLLVTILVSILSIASYAEDGWTLEKDTIYTHGSTVHSHKFGYFKDTEYCGNDLIYIQWSTYEEGLKEFEGVDAKIAIRINGEDEVITVMPSTLMSTAKFPVLMTIGDFRTILYSKELSKEIRESQNIEFTFVGPEDLVSKLDIKSDVFDTSRLAAAYSKFDNSCESL